MSEWFNERSRAFKILLAVIVLTYLPIVCCGLFVGYRTNWILWQLGLR